MANASNILGLDAVRTALRACEQECRRHGAHLRHCTVCADVCARAEEPGPHCRPPPEVDLAPPPQDPLSPGAAMGTSGAAPEPNEPA
jgi:hypothetical protein